MRYAKRLLAGCCAVTMGLGFSYVPVQAASDHVVINEICAKNTSYPAADGSCYDWIELYNPTPQPVDLSGYGLSDKQKSPFLFTFPEGTVIGSKERLLVFCDSLLTQLPGQLAAPFGISTSGETLFLTAPDGVTADTVTIGPLAADVSYGRVPDGSDTFATTEMTPGTANEAQDIISLDIPEPEFSTAPGFYDNGFSLSMTVPDGMTVYYTLDGTTPTAESTAYTGPIDVRDVSADPNVLSARTDIAPSSWMSPVRAPHGAVEKAFIISAVAVDSEGHASDVVNGAYFIGCGSRASYYQDMKVISIVTDSDNLYDYDTGIYVLGKVHDDWRNGPDYSPMTDTWVMPANYTQKGREWERSASMQIYEDGQLVHSQNVGLRIHGGASRSYTQKSFNVYARTDYGASKFDFDLFSGTLRSEASGKKIKEFDSFMLRNAGNDAQYARYRDKLNQALVSGRSILTQAMEPCIVFINGEYWGHYEITEKVDEDFVDAHYKVGKNNVCIIKNEELDEGDAQGYDEWEQLYSWIRTADLSSDANYKTLCEKVDMQSFADYVSAEIYYNNWDWGGNNMAMWKSMVTDPENPYADGRWRFILFDTEYSANIYGEDTSRVDSFTQLTKGDSFLADLLKVALKNPAFKEQFCVTFMDMANENFSTDKVNALVDQYAAQYHDFTIDTYNRFYPDWPGGGYAEEQCSNEAQLVRSFYTNRYGNITRHLKNYCSLQGNLAAVTVLNDPAAGDVTINTIHPDFADGSWKGSYYTDYPVTLRAQSKGAYAFDHWQLSDGTVITTEEAQIQLTGDMTVEAVYTEAVIGDVNRDGVFDDRDIADLQSWILGKDISLPGWRAGDLCEDGQLNVFDLIAMKRLLGKNRGQQ